MTLVLTYLLLVVTIVLLIERCRDLSRRVDSLEWRILRMERDRDG